MGKDCAFSGFCVFVIGCVGQMNHAFMTFVLVRIIIIAHNGGGDNGCNLESI